MGVRSLARPQLWIVTVVCVSCSLMFATASCGGPSQDYPSDSELERRFAEHTADFEELVRMSDEDSKVIAITPEYTALESDVGWPRPESEWGISRDRWDRYRELFALLGLKNGLLRLSGKSEVEFFTSTTGLVTGGTSKGYIHSLDDMAPVVDSLDGIEKTAKRGNTYKKIKDHWYLFYYND
jgi:hypothetical protein